MSPLDSIYVCECPLSAGETRKLYEVHGFDDDPGVICAYCADCAELAYVNWTGEVSGVFPVDRETAAAIVARFYSDDEPAPDLERAPLPALRAYAVALVANDGAEDALALEALEAALTVAP